VRFRTHAVAVHPHGCLLLLLLLLLLLRSDKKHQLLAAYLM
jgi:hypothetical protein